MHVAKNKEKTILICCNHNSLKACFTVIVVLYIVIVTEFIQSTFNCNCF